MHAIVFFAMFLLMRQVVSSNGTIVCGNDVTSKCFQDSTCGTIGTPAPRPISLTVTSSRVICNATGQPGRSLDITWSVSPGYKYIEGFEIVVTGGTKFGQKNYCFRIQPNSTDDKKPTAFKFASLDCDLDPPQSYRPGKQYNVKVSSVPLHYSDTNDQFSEFRITIHEFLTQQDPTTTMAMKEPTANTTEPAELTNLPRAPTRDHFLWIVIVVSSFIILCLLLFILCRMEKKKTKVVNASPVETPRLYISKEDERIKENALMLLSNQERVGSTYTESSQRLAEELSSHFDVTCSWRSRIEMSTIGVGKWTRLSMEQCPIVILICSPGSRQIIDAKKSIYRQNEHNFFDPLAIAIKEMMSEMCMARHVCIVCFDSLCKHCLMNNVNVIGKVQCFKIPSQLSMFQNHILNLRMDPADHVISITKPFLAENNNDSTIIIEKQFDSAFSSRTTSQSTE